VKLIFQLPLGSIGVGDGDGVGDATGVGEGVGPVEAVLVPLLPPHPTANSSAIIMTNKLIFFMGELFSLCSPVESRRITP
jgi:hypothetical protein